MSTWSRGHVMVFLYGAATLLFLQFFQRFLLNAGFNPNDMGYLVAGAFFVEVIATVPTGVLADSLGVKRVTVFGLPLLAIACGFASLGSGWPPLVGGFLLYKIADSTVSGVLNVWAKNIPGATQGQSSGFIFTRLDQMQRVGMILMAVACGLLIESLGYGARTPWVISLIFAVVLGLIAIKTPCTSSVSIKNRTYSDVIRNLRTSLMTGRGLQIALLGVFVLGISEGLMNSKYWTWVIEDLGYGAPLALAAIIALQSLSRVAGQEFFIRFVPSERARFLIALFGISLITLVFALPLSAAVLVGMWFVRIFVYASYFPLLNKELESISDPSVISSVLSTAPLLNALGACFGGLLCSGLQLNSQITFVLMALLCGVSGALWFTVFRGFATQPEGVRVIRA